MKQHEPNIKEINGATFYIRPFPSWTSIEVHGDLIFALAPIIAPVAGAAGAGDTEGSIADIDVSMFIKAMSAMSGEKLVVLLKKLLTKHKNIAVETEDGAKQLDDELANEVFCGNVQDMFILAWEVIRANFPSIFEKLGGLFGGQKVTEMMAVLKNSGN